MQVYAIKLHNFMRFGEANNSVVFDLTDQQKEDIAKNKLNIDQVYDSFKKDPLNAVKEAKARGIERVIGIIGLNGSGKSSILESICYSHYDKIVRKLVNSDKEGKAGLSVVTKINRKYPENMKESWVEEFFEEGDKVYRIKRGRSFSKNHKSSSPILEFECFNENSESEMGHRSTDTNANIEKVNQLDYDMFVNSQMFAQNDAGKFLTGTDKIKKEMIIGLVRMESVVDGCLRETRDRKNSQDKKVSTIRSNIELMEKNVVRGHSKWVTTDDQEKYGNVYSLEFVASLIATMDKYILDKRTEITTLSDEIIRIDKQVEELEKTNEMTLLKSIQEEGQKVKQEKENKEKLIEQQCKTWEDLIIDNNQTVEKKKTNKNAITTKIEAVKVNKEKLNKFIQEFNMQKCNDYLEKIEKAKVVKPETERSIEFFNKDRDTLVKEIASLQTVVYSVKSDVSDMKKQLEKSVGNSEFVCSSCQSKVTKSHIELKISEAEIRIKDGNEKWKELNFTLGKTDEEIKLNKERLEKINDCLLNEGKIQAKIKEFNDAKAKLVEVEEGALEYITQSGQLDTEIDACETKIKDYKNKKEEIKKQFEKDLNELAVKYTELKERFKKVKEEAEGIQKKINDYKKRKVEIETWKSDKDKEIGSTTKEIESIKKNSDDIRDLKITLDVSSKEYNRLLLLEDVWGLDGIQTRIVKKFLPLLNSYMQEYMGLLSGGKISLTLEVNDRSEVCLSIFGATAESYEMLSGGEKNIVRLAVDISLALLSFSLLSRKPEMICLDEVFGPLDNFNTENVFKMLMKLNSTFERIIIISHKKDIQKAINNNIIVEKSTGSGGLSEIKTLGGLDE